MLVTVPEPGPVTELLGRSRAGDQQALEQVVELLYRELRHMAGRQMVGEARHHTLQPTALVHEVLMRLLPASADIKNRHHFLSLAARSMRRVLVDFARERKARKRGRDFEKVSLDDDMEVGAPPRSVDVLDLDLALSELEGLNQRAARVFELRSFGGYTIEETATIVDMSVPTVRRDFEEAQTWLRQRLRPPHPSR